MSRMDEFTVWTKTSVQILEENHPEVPTQIFYMCTVPNIGERISLGDPSFVLNVQHRKFIYNPDTHLETCVLTVLRIDPLTEKAV